MRGFFMREGAGAVIVVVLTRIPEFCYSPADVTYGPVVARLNAEKTTTRSYTLGRQPWIKC